MSHLVDFDAVPPFDVWGESVRARSVNGERLSLAIVELAPGSVVPEHRHEHEQLGMVGLRERHVHGRWRDAGAGTRGHVAHPVGPAPRRRHRTRWGARHRRLRARPGGLGGEAPPRAPPGPLAGALTGRLAGGRRAGPTLAGRRMIEPPPASRRSSSSPATATVLGRLPAFVAATPWWMDVGPGRPGGARSVRAGRDGPAAPRDRATIGPRRRGDLSRRGRPGDRSTRRHSPRSSPGRDG